MRMKKLKKIVAVMLTIGLGVGAFTACDNSAEDDEPVTIDFWHHYSAQSKENEILENELIPKFEAEHENIKVNAVSHEWADLHDKILINAKADTLADVARLDITWIPEFEEADILVPLNQEFDDFDNKADSLLENAMNTTKIDDNYYGLALNTNTKILFYNSSAIEDAGIKVPETLDELKEATRSLSGTNDDGQKVWGFCEVGLSGWNVLPYIWSYGGDILNPEQTQASGYVNSEETVAAVEMLAELYQEDALTGWNSGDIPMTDGFGTERYMMLLEGPWKIAELEGAYPDLEYGTANMPAGEGGSHSVLGGEDISMFRGDNQEAAWEFMKFMTDEYAQVEMSKAGQIPVNKAALENEKVKEAEFAPFLEAIENAKSRPTVANWNEIDNELAIALDAVMNGEKPAQEAMDELAETIDGLLAE